jgi:hypothetical protein
MREGAFGYAFAKEAAKFFPTLAAANIHDQQIISPTREVVFHTPVM